MLASSDDRSKLPHEGCQWSMPLSLSAVATSPCWPQSTASVDTRILFLNNDAITVYLQRNPYSNSPPQLIMDSRHHGGLHKAALHHGSPSPINFVAGSHNFQSKIWLKSVNFYPNTSKHTLLRLISPPPPSITMSHGDGGITSPSISTLANDDPSISILRRKTSESSACGELGGGPNGRQPRSQMN